MDGILDPTYLEVFSTVTEGVMYEALLVGCVHNFHYRC